jgi:SAM-dependent methyltransferase
MTSPAAPSPPTEHPPTPDHTIPDAQARLEKAWRSRLLTEPSESAFREAYDALHAVMRDGSGRARLYEESLTRLDRAFLSRLPLAGRVLDIGAGNGRFALATAASHWVAALEISREAIAAMRPLAEERGRLVICQASGLQLPFLTGRFDAVVSQDLVEHLHPSQLEPHLAEAYRVLAPGGRYLLHTPSRLQGPTSFGLHLREYRLREMRRAAEACGFRSRWICLNLSRFGWAGTAPAWLWPVIEAWEMLWEALGRLGLRRLGGRGYAVGIPDVDLELLKPGYRCGSST